MAQMLIMLRRNPENGKHNIIVKLESEPDALPIEHEQLHKQLVQKLLDQGMPADDVGDLIIERVRQPISTPGVSQEAVPNESQANRTSS